MSSRDATSELIRKLHAELRRHGDVLAALEHHQAIGAVRMAGALGSLADIRRDVSRIRRRLEREAGAEEGGGPQ